MCTSLREGGKRCEYADIIANERRKLRWKHRNAWNREAEVEKGLRVWKEKNKELVKEHLPEKMSFQVAPNKKSIPEDLKALLSPKGQPISGLSTADRLKMTFDLAVARENWEGVLSNNEDNAVGRYTMSGFESLNPFLRKKGYVEWKKQNPSSWRVRDEERPYEEFLAAEAESLDAAFAKSKLADKPRKLYRFFRVPAGVNPTDYIEKYFAAGGAYQDKGYMSTTADLEFILAHMHDRNKGKKNHGYVIMEILTKQGQSVQPTETPKSGNVQSLENELLIPRGAKFRIAETRSRQKFAFGGDRPDLEAHYRNSNFRYDNEGRGGFIKGFSMSFPVIQMVDEELIRPTKRSTEGQGSNYIPFDAKAAMEKEDAPKYAHWYRRTKERIEAAEKQGKEYDPNNITLDLNKVPQSIKALLEE